MDAVCARAWLGRARGLARRRGGGVRCVYPGHGERYMHQTRRCARREPSRECEDGRMRGCEDARMRARRRARRGVCVYVNMHACAYVLTWCLHCSWSYSTSRSRIVAVPPRLRARAIGIGIGSGNPAEAGVGFELDAQIPLARQLVGHDDIDTRVDIFGSLVIHRHSNSRPPKSVEPPTPS